MNKVIITADSTCDLNNELKEIYEIKTIPLHVVLGDKVYEDSVNIYPKDIFDNFYKTKQLPKTAAINGEEYIAFFKPFVESGYDIVHINIGSGISVCHQNCKLAAVELGANIYPVDSGNLSTGTGHLVIEAAERARQGMSAEKIAEEVNQLAKKLHSSFVIEHLDFLHAGGRCSALALLGANLLGLKPSILVSNDERGKMGVGKKYRGKLEKVLLSYVEDVLANAENIKSDRVFITYSTIDEALLKKIKSVIKKKNIFRDIHITTTSCTISSHCGPNTLGVIYMEK